jgi:hypothetical protein
MRNVEQYSIEEIAKYNAVAEYLEEQSRLNRVKRHSNKDIINECLPEWNEAGIELFKLTAYQWRFIKGDYKVDYYPTSERYYDHQQKLWDSISAQNIPDLFPDYNYLQK